MKKILTILIAIIVLALTVVPAFAAPSPNADVVYDIEIMENEGGKITYSTEIIDGKTYVTVTVKENPGYKFIKWIIDGKYTIYKGSLTSKTLVFIAESDCKVSAKFEGVGIVDVDKNDSGTSPDTGDNNVYFLYAGLLLAALTVVGAKTYKAKK